MNIIETVSAKGQVKPRFVDLSTGAELPFHIRHNTLSYDAARAIAGAFGGDSTLVPNRIGIVYGPSGLQFDTITRQQSWADLKSDMESKHSDVQIRTFSYSPSVARVYGQEESSSNSSDDKSGWGVTFHMHSDSVTRGVFGTASGVFSNGSTIYQAVLLNKTNGNYTVLARVDLGDSGTYRKKPDNFELALDWTVKFF